MKIYSTPLFLAMTAAICAGCNIDPQTGTSTEHVVQTKTAVTPVAEPQKNPDPRPILHTQDQGEDSRRLYKLSDLEKGALLANGRKLDVWLMDTDSKREEGMMWLLDKHVKDNQGMLFVFKDMDSRGFWMQNTLIPLDIIYVDDKGKVVNIVYGKPKDQTTLYSTGPAKYVLELKEGRAKMFGIKAGTKLTLPPNATAKD